MSEVDPSRNFDRELSWVAFNGRVLQEAQNPDVPLFERLAFLAIVSSNLDEFFRVRVASLRTLLRVRKKKLKKMGVRPRRLLGEIHAAVHVQQEAGFGGTLVRDVLPGLAREGIELVSEREVPPSLHGWLREYFDREVLPHLNPMALQDGEEALHLEDRRTYLVSSLWDSGGGLEVGEEPTTVLVAVPDHLPRFATLGPDGEVDQSPSEPRRVMFLDDVIRFNLDRLFPGRDVDGVYAVKLSRDADLRIEDQFEGDLADKIRKALSRRASGIPSRFLYDPRAPYRTIAELKSRLELDDEDLFAGGRYHSLSDFFSFPRFDRTDLAYQPLEPLPHAGLEGEGSILERIADRDHLLHLPYQSFGPVIAFVREAARDPAVEEIWASLYRVARDSAVVQALIDAAERGKRVTAFVEVQARFDEASNLAWADRMEAAGIRVLYSRPGIKVHAKLLLVVRAEEGQHRTYAYLGTGNLNEKTARTYTDLGLFTAHRGIGAEVHQVFRELETGSPTADYGHLLVAPEGMRRGFVELTEHEMEQAARGHQARMILKMNSLEDPEMIETIRKAARAGVEVELIVRGICCLRVDDSDPGVIRIRSIIDRFLEHSRVYAFHNGGDPRVYVASADWMIRNLTRRVEVAVPILDPVLRDELLDVLDLQLSDNVKARWIDRDQTNPFVRSPGPPVRSQMEHYRYLQGRSDSRAIESGGG